MSEAERNARKIAIRAALDRLLTGKCGYDPRLTCIDLRAAFPRYRTRMSADHEKGHAVDPWNVEIPCGRWKASVYPHGGTLLQAWITTRIVGPALAELEAAGCVPFQVGGGEATVVFDTEDAPSVLGILGARLKRVPSAATLSHLSSLRGRLARLGSPISGKPIAT